MTTGLTDIVIMEPKMDIEIFPRNIAVSSNTEIGNDLSLQIQEVRSLNNDKNIVANRVMPRILQKKGDRSTFLKRLGMTNKNLYEEYLQFKKKNKGKPIVGMKSKTKYITPTKYKKPEDKVEKPRLLSNKEPANLPNKLNDILQKTSAPHSSNSKETLLAKFMTSSPSEILGNNFQSLTKEPVSQSFQVKNNSVMILPKTTTVSSSTATSNIQPIIILDKHQIVPSSVNSVTGNQPFTIVSNTITTPPGIRYSKPSVQNSKPSSSLNKYPLKSNINPVVKLMRLNVSESSNSVIYVDDEPRAVSQSKNKTSATENLAQVSKSVSKKIKKTTAINSQFLGFPPISSSTPKATSSRIAPAPQRIDNAMSFNNCLSSNRATIMSADPVKQNLLMQPKTFGNMKTKSEMGQYIKQIQETITAINGVIGVPVIGNKGTEPKSAISVSQAAKKTFRDKATMANNNKQTINMNKRLSRMKKKNEMLRMKIKNMQKQLNERRKPLYEQVDKIEEMKSSGNTQAIFLMEQINNFDKKMVKFSFENMTIFTVLLKRSQKGYQFLQHYNILGMPSRSTVRRFLNRDGNFQEKYVDDD